jgi:hypothetical protein
LKLAAKVIEDIEFTASGHFWGYASPSPGLFQRFQ